MVCCFLFFKTLYRYRQDEIEKVPFFKNKDDNKDEIKLEGSDWFVCLLKARIKNNKMLEGPGRPLNLLEKMLIITTPGGKIAATPLERGKCRYLSSFHDRKEGGIWKYGGVQLYF